jgi:hypothetical protein
MAFWDTTIVLGEAINYSEREVSHFAYVVHIWQHTFFGYLKCGGRMHRPIPHPPSNLILVPLEWVFLLCFCLRAWTKNRY